MTDQTVTSVQIIHYILKSLDTQGPVALFTFSSSPAELHTGTRAERVLQKLSQVSTHTIIYLQIRKSFAETLSSLYTHNHLPADQTAAMTPTPVALSLGKNHTHLVRFVVFTELLSWRHCNWKGHHPCDHTSILAWSRSAFLKLISLCPHTTLYFSPYQCYQSIFTLNNTKIKDAVHLPVVFQSTGLQYNWHKVKTLRTQNCQHWPLSSCSVLQICHCCVTAIAKVPLCIWFHPEFFLSARCRWL